MKYKCILEELNFYIFIFFLFFLHLIMDVKLKKQYFIVKFD